MTTVYAKSAGRKFAGATNLVTVECTCGMLFAIPERLNDAALQHRGPKGWQITCPLGHSWHYTGVSAAERIRLLKDTVANERARRDQAEASARAHRGAATRARNQRDRLKAHATAGVCPVDGCHRHFTNLERHIASKHPAYATTPHEEHPTC